MRRGCIGQENDIQHEQPHDENEDRMSDKQPFTFELADGFDPGNKILLDDPDFFYKGM